MMLQLQCVDIFISFLCTWASYIPLLINNFVSRNFEGLFFKVSLIFYRICLQHHKGHIFC